jgi:hypothetical protein
MSCPMPLKACLKSRATSPCRPLRTGGTELQRSAFQTASRTSASAARNDNCNRVKLHSSPTSIPPAQEHTQAHRHHDGEDHSNCQHADQGHESGFHFCLPSAPTDKLMFLCYKGSMPGHDTSIRQAAQLYMSRAPHSELADSDLTGLSGVRPRISGKTNRQKNEEWMRRLPQGIWGTRRGTTRYARVAPTRHGIEPRLRFAYEFTPGRRGRRARLDLTQRACLRSLGKRTVISE